MSDVCADKILDTIPALGHMIRSRIGAIAEEELSVSQFRVLGILRLGTLNNKELADWIGVSLPVMSRLVQGLVEREIIERVQSRDDRRQVKLSLSKKGEKVFASARKVAIDALRKPLSSLSPREMSQLNDGLNVLNKILANSHDQGEN